MDELDKVSSDIDDAVLAGGDKATLDKLNESKEKYQKPMQKGADGILIKLNENNRPFWAVIFVLTLAIQGKMCYNTIVKR